MLGHLQGTSCPAIAISTHQCAKYNNGPKLSHKRTVKKVVRYLLETRDKGISNLQARSTQRIGMLRRCWFFWLTEGWQSWRTCISLVQDRLYEYVCLVSHYTEEQDSNQKCTEYNWERIYYTINRFIKLTKEIASIFGLLTRKPVFKCKVWEDNDSCITVAKAPTFTPCTKHIAIKYHHFRSFVSEGTIVINPIDTSEQLADMLTKPLKEQSFCYLRKGLMSW